MLDAVMERAAGASFGGRGPEGVDFEGQGERHGAAAVVVAEKDR